MTGPAWDGSERTAAAGTIVHAAVLGPAGAREVVCVHGLGCSHRYFTPLARALAPAARAVAPDLPGFGKTRGPSRALDVRGLSLALGEWLRVTGRGGAPMVANSMGCQVVADLAVHSPDLLGPVVLAGPTMDPHARTPLRQAARLAANAPFERLSLWPVLLRDYAACGPRRFLATFAHALADRIERKLPLVQTPAVVVRGARDVIVPRRWGAEAAALLPRGELVEVPGAGHTLNYSAPGPLAAITRSLLER